jgi:uncharacterized protein YeaO (DUF488 family)
VLVDRLWPRGTTRERAALDLWLKDAAPSPDLRVEWHHDPQRFDEFAARYRAELDSNPAVDELLTLARTHGTVTLLDLAFPYTAGFAAVLRAYLGDARGRGAEK